MIGPPTADEIWVEIFTGQKVRTEMCEGTWRSDDAEDVVLLRFKDGTPQDVKAVSLGSHEGTVGHRFWTFGFLVLGDINGLREVGEIAGETRKEATGISLLRLSLYPGFYAVIHHFRKWITGHRRAFCMPRNVFYRFQYRKLIRKALCDLALPTSAISALEKAIYLRESGRAVGVTYPRPSLTCPAFLSH